MGDTITLDPPLGLEGLSPVLCPLELAGVQAQPARDTVSSFTLSWLQGYRASTSHYGQSLFRIGTVHLKCRQFNEGVRPSIIPECLLAQVCPLADWAPLLRVRWCFSRTYKYLGLVFLHTSHPQIDNRIIIGSSKNSSHRNGTKYIPTLQHK